MAEKVGQVPRISVGNYKVEVIIKFTDLRSTIPGNLFLDKDIDRRIGEAAVTLTKLSKRV